MTDTTAKMETAAKRGGRVHLSGVVVSDKRDQTIGVRHEYKVKHPKYGKYIRRSSTLQTHDPKNEAKVGDIVEVVSCRRMSKTKCWRLVRIIRPGHGG